MVGGRWIVRDGRHPHEDDVLARYRDMLARLRASPMSPLSAFDLCSSTRISRRWRTRRLRRDPRRRGRRDGDDRIAWVGRACAILPRDAHGRTRRSRARGAWADAGPRRLPHASRLRGQPRERIRARASTARRTRKSRAKAAASLRRCAQRAPRATTSSRAQSLPRLAALAAEGVDDGRDQVRLRARHGERVRSSFAWRAALACRARRRRAHDAARGARAAAGVRGTRRRLRRLRVPRHHPGGRARRARRRRRCVLRDDRLHARRRRGACSRPRARTGCR